MSVNHALLPITTAELEVILQTPERVRELVEQREADIVELGKEGPAVVALTAEAADDPLTFLLKGGPENESGWVGWYRVEGGVGTCEVEMGYGPGSYFRNEFLQKVADRLRVIQAEDVAARFDPDWLEEACVYPGAWHGRERKEHLVDAFSRYRACILRAAESGQHLLMWCH